MGSWWSQFKQPASEGNVVSTGTSGGTVTKAVSWQSNYPVQVNTQPMIQPTEPRAILANQGYLGKAPASVRETQTCPECGSTNFFSRTLGVMRGPAPAPLCAECGYNGLFTQSGTLLNSAGVLSGGPTHQARSDNPGGSSQLDWSHPIHMPGQR